RLQLRLGFFLLQIFLNPFNHFFMFQKFASLGCHQTFLNLLDEPCFIIQEPVYGLLYKLGSVPASADGKLLKASFFLWRRLYFHVFSLTAADDRQSSFSCQKPTAKGQRLTSG